MKEIHFDKEAAEEAIQQHQEYVDSINKFSEALKKEGITLTNEILNSFIDQGQEYLAEILIKGTIDQYNKVGMMINSVTHESICRSSEVVAERFQKHQELLRETRSEAGGVTVPINEDGNAVLSASEMKEIHDKHTVFLQKKDEKLYESLVQHVAEINKIAQDLKGKLDLSLYDCLTTISTQGNFTIGFGMKRELSRDTYFILKKDGELEVNPVFFIKPNIANLK